MRATPSSPLDQLRNAAIRYRAVLHNCESGSSPEEQKAWDERIGVAEIEIERACLDACLMHANDAIQELCVIQESEGQPRELRILLDSGKKIAVPF